jgi:Na+/H+-dicarboxylate symporter
MTERFKPKSFLIFSACLLISLSLYIFPVASIPIPVEIIQIIRVIALFVALFLAFERLFKVKIYTKIFLGLILGIVFGIFLSPDIAEIKPIGELFIKLIKMIIIPLVFASLLIGASSMNPKKMGRVGVKTLIYYLLYTAAAIAIGLVLANIFSPGSGMDESLKVQLMENFKERGQEISQVGNTVNPIQTLLNVIPVNIFGSLSAGKLLPIIFFALFMGIGLSLIDEDKAKPVIAFFNGINEVMIKIVNIVIKLAPYGVLALIATVVADFGTDILLSLLKYALLTITGLILLNFTYPPIVRLFTGMKMSVFMKRIWPVQLIAFSTSSSSATLPVTISTCETKLGVPSDIASFVLPLGATVNMNGTALYHGVSALFIAQVMGIELGLAKQLTIVLTSTLAAIGTAGAPMAGTLMLVMVLEAVGIPSAGIALILGVERILDMFRTAINITGDASAAVVIAATEGELEDISS